MGLLFKRKDDGTFDRSGELPSGTKAVWIYADDRRSKSPFEAKLAMRLIERGTVSLPWVQRYLLEPADSGGLVTTKGLDTDQIEGLAGFYHEFGWTDENMTAPYALFVSVENERWVKISDKYELERDEQGKRVVVQCGHCRAEFFIIYHKIFKDDVSAKKRALEVRERLKGMLTENHELGSRHVSDRPFEIV